MLTNLQQKRHFLRVTWGDWAWRPEIIVRPIARPVPAWGESARLVAPMRNGVGMLRIADCRPRRYRAAPAGRSRFAFTLVELLVVMGIIAILAAMLVPAVIKMKERAKIGKAKLEISKIAQAISSYETAYSRPPITSTNLGLASKAFASDFTFGGSYRMPDPPYTNYIAYAPPNVVPPNLANVWLNSDVMAIVMDLEAFGNGSATVNRGHVKNTQKTKFLTEQIQGDSVSPGVGADGVFRDPWGNPYIISLDTNGDDKTRDAFYSAQKVSDPNNIGVGLNGLIKATVGGIAYYEFQGSVMVWSAGPDGKVDPNIPANQGVNKDNILSWKP